MSDPRLKLYDQGYTDLVCVAPPGAPLSANSSLDPNDLGKRPSVRGENGLWFGYPWVTAQPTREQVETYAGWGANIGLRGDRFPALDIDSGNEKLVAVVEKAARELLGPAPRRVGRAPRSLLVYRTREPFSRAAIEIEYEGEKHLVEFLGRGKQYLVYGEHPTAGSYEWTTTPLWEIPSTKLKLIDASSVEGFFATLAERLASAGIETRLVGSARTAADGDTPAQQELLAPSIEALRAAVASIPNDEEYDDRDDYITMGHAIKGAAGDDDSAGLEIFLEWAGRWEGGNNDPATVRADWRRMHAPFHIGWEWIAARAAGTAVARYEFEADPNATPPPVASSPHGPNLYTDDWLAEQILPEIAQEMRYDFPTGRWHVWDGVAWREDSGGRSAERILIALRRLSARLTARAEALGKDEAKALRRALNRIGEAPTQSRVTSMLEMRTGIRCEPDTFDQRVMELNTPKGIVDLTTGEVRAPDREAMHSKTTKVAPAETADAPLWRQFMEEITQGDEELARYLQKLAGYCLTGTIREHVLTFIWGPGGNGKSVWLNTLASIMDDYSTPAPLTTFFRGPGDSHPTEMAGLMGARLVTAPETQAGRVWDEQKIKTVTSGDPMRARFMRQDYVEFLPRFKLLVVGNHPPRIEQIDDAMKRRLNIVPFTFKPDSPDVDLPEKLEAEYPAILRWAIDGCLMWHREGLEPPEVVRSRTETYFEEEDVVRQWLLDTCELDPQGRVSRQALYDSWRVWCQQNGEHAGSLRTFRGLLAPALEDLPVKDRKVGDRESRVNGYWGLKLKGSGGF